VATGSSAVGSGTAVGCATVCGVSSSSLSDGLEGSAAGAEGSAAGSEG
jgi:hypothetical protein